jgi:hypothetical protein
LGLGITRSASEKQPHGQLYYPGVSELASAQVIDLAPGERVDLGDFVLPAPLEQRLLTGVVLYPDGTPAAGATVILWAVRGGSIRDSRSATTDGGGRYTFRAAYAGEHYRLTAFLNPPDAGGRAQWTAKSADFELTSETPSQKLVLESVRRSPR